MQRFKRIEALDTNPASNSKKLIKYIFESRNIIRMLSFCIGRCHVGISTFDRTQMFKLLLNRLNLWSYMT